MRCRSTAWQRFGLPHVPQFGFDSQRTLYPVPEIRLLPAREFPIGEVGRTRFRQRFRETFEGDASRIALYRDVSNGTPTAAARQLLDLTCRRE